MSSATLDTLGWLIRATGAVVFLAFLLLVCLAVAEFADGIRNPPCPVCGQRHRHGPAHRYPSRTTGR